MDKKDHNLVLKCFCENRKTQAFFTSCLQEYTSREEQEFLIDLIQEYASTSRKIKEFCKKY